MPKTKKATSSTCPYVLATTEIAKLNEQLDKNLKKDLDAAIKRHTSVRNKVKDTSQKEDFFSQA